MGTSDNDAVELFRRIWRRKMTLVATVGILTLLTLIVTQQVTPRYTASAKVMLDPRENQVVDIQTVIAGLPSDLETVESEIEVLKSRGLARRAVAKLDLASRPEFNPALIKPSKWRKYLSLKNYLGEELAELVFPANDGGQLSRADRRKRVDVEIIQNFLSRLHVSRRGRSRVIEISFESVDATLAATAANTVADLYIVEQLEAKFEATKRATEWLDDRLSDLRDKVEGSERAVEKLRKDSGLMEGKGVTMGSQQLSELNTQVIIARTKTAEAEARLQQIETLMRAAKDLASVAEVLTSPLIQRLREQEVTIQRRAAELAQEYGKKHPKMINIRAEIRDLQDKISGEVKTIVQGLRNELKIAEARETALMAGMRQLENRVAVLNRSQIGLRTLQREARANRTLYETFLGRFKETSAQDGLQQPDARVISRADIPTNPSFPRKNLILGIALLVSVGIGIGLLMVLEWLDNGFRSMDQVESITGVSGLGLIPTVPRNKGMKVEPQDYILERPGSAYAESIRALYAGLLLSNVDKPPKIVLITSALPNEGKTTLALALARGLARSGQKKVVLVDCDLRRAQIAEKLALQNAPGLVECLSGEAKLDDALQVDESSGALILPAGRSPASPTDLFSSLQFRELLKTLADASDLVVLDSSPVLAVSDSRILARHADKTIFISRWAETRREVAMTALKQIIDAGADVAGVALSMVNVKKHARYRYSDSGYYYGRHRKYYIG